MKSQTDITHLQAQKLLQLSQDSPLDEEQAIKIHQHLKDCAECRNYAGKLKIMVDDLGSSLQERWPPMNVNDVKSSAAIANTLSKVSSDNNKNHAHIASNVGWVALVVLLISGLVWSIKTLAPIPFQIPAAVSSPALTTEILLPGESPLPALTATSQGIQPTPTINILPSTSVSLFPTVNFIFPSALPSSPDRMVIFQQQLSPAVTAVTARQIASQWGINGGIYSSPSEGMGDVIYNAMDGSRSMRFLNFPDQFIYQVGYVSPDYGSALMDNGPLPPFEDQVKIAINFLEPFGILDLPYQTSSLETERGVVGFIPQLDGYPVIQEIGVDRSNIGWIDVKVNTLGQVTMVQYSHHNFKPVADYPILTAQQGWDRFSKDVNLQHSRYAVLSPKQPNTYQVWVRSFQPGENADLYGYVNAYQSDESASPPLVMIGDLPITGDISGMVPSNQYEVKFVHIWGQILANSTDGIALQAAGWEASSLIEDYITGTLTIQGGQAQLIALDRTLSLQDPPLNIPDGLQVGIQGVVLDGDPPILNWKFIETGEIQFSYAGSNSCGGGGSGGGGNVPNADFGGGGFASLNLDGQEVPVSTQAVEPFHTGDQINAISGIVSITRHLYLGGKTSDEIFFYPDPPRDLATDWGYALIGYNLSGIDQYQSLPVRVWGKVDHLDKGIIYLNVDRFEPIYPGLQIQAWSGTEQIVTVEGQDVVLFTTSGGEQYIVNSSLVWGAENNVIGYLGDLIEIEGFVFPDNLVGGYPVIKDLAGSSPPDGVIDSANVNVWDHSQDPASNPGAVLQGNVTIDSIELGYDAINLDRCQASASEDPNMASWLYVQPMWVFNGHFEDGRRFIAQVQALPDEYMK